MDVVRELHDENYMDVVVIARPIYASDRKCLIRNLRDDVPSQTMGIEVFVRKTGC